MGREDKKTDEKIAFEVLIRNTISMEGNVGLNSADPFDPGTIPALCGSATPDVSIRSAGCPIMVW